MLQCVAVCCSVLQCVAVRCCVLQCVAVLQCVKMGTNFYLMSSNASPAVLTCFGVRMVVHANMSEILLCVGQRDNVCMSERQYAGWVAREGELKSRKRDKENVHERESERVGERACTHVHTYVHPQVKDRGGERASTQN